MWFMHVAAAMLMAAHVSVVSEMDDNIRGFAIGFLLSQLVSVLQQVEVVYNGRPRPERAMKTMLVR